MLDLTNFSATSVAAPRRNRDLLICYFGKYCS